LDAIGQTAREILNEVPRRFRGTLPDGNSSGTPVDFSGQIARDRLP
jgi:hypothetical protein